MSQIRPATAKSAWVTVMLILLLVLAACGGATPAPAAEEAAPAAEEAAPAAEAPAAEAPAAEAAEAVTDTAEAAAEDPAAESAAEAETALTLWVIGEQRVPTLNELGAQFAEEFGVAVNVEVVDIAEIRNQLLLGAGTGEGPDMAIIPHDNIGALSENDVLAEIDLGAAADSFLAPAIDAFTYEGKLLGVPIAVENIGFFRNTELVPDAPATWAEVREIGAALVEAGTVEQAVALPDLGYNIYPLYTSFGGYIFGRDEAGSYTADDLGIAGEGMIEGLSWVTSLVEDGLVSPNVDWEAAHVLFESGQAPFIFTGPWAITRFDTAGVPYAVSAFPAASEGGEPGAPFMGVQGLVLNANSPDLLLAQTFATEILATEAAQAALFAQEPTPSAWTSVFENATDARIVGFSEAGVNAQPMPAIPAMGSVWDPWAAAGTLAVQGALSAAEALQAAAEQVVTALAQ